MSGISASRGRMALIAVELICAHALIANSSVAATAQSATAPSIVNAPEAGRSPASALGPARQTLPGTIACTVHVWPAATTHTTFQGWWRAGAIDGARRGLGGYPDLRADAIDTAHQEQVLRSLDWTRITGDPDRVVVHPAPTGSDDDRGRTSRLVTDGSACYREVIISSSIIEVATFSTRSVRILALGKTFYGTAPPTNFSSMTNMSITLPENIQPGDPAIDEATRAAFAAAVGKFAVILSLH